MTALHKDPYENVYVQIAGRKHFVLLPPVEAPVVCEKWVRSGTYIPTAINSGFDLLPTPDEPHHTLPFATYDPDSPIETKTTFSHLSKPLRVTLEPGDMLYLPALWYHKVSQSCSEEGICCAINYWYDMEFSGSFWSMASFIRGVGMDVSGEEKNGQETKRG